MTKEDEFAFSSFPLSEYLSLSHSLIFRRFFFILFPTADKNKDRAVVTHLRCVYVCV